MTNEMEKDPADRGRDGEPREGQERDGLHRGGRVFGAALIILGLLFLAVQWSPALLEWLDISRSWPLIIVAVAAFLALLGLANVEPDLAIPATIVGGLGLLLFYQNATGDWGSWAYTWALIPAFVGLGLLLAVLFSAERRKRREQARVGTWMLVISLSVFFFFASWLGGHSGLGRWWPLGIVAIGAWLLVQSVRRASRGGAQAP